MGCIKFFTSFSSSFKSILNIVSVLLLIFTVYALITVEVFGLTRLGKTANYQANFRDFGTAMLTLFRMTTGEAWNKIMHEMMIEFPFCSHNNYTYLMSDCGSTAWGLGIFLSFEIVAGMILMSLFVVTVIDNFDFTSQEDAMLALFTQEDLTNYKHAWSEFDPKGTGYIKKENVTKLLRVSVYLFINFDFQKET